jgi:hypothetical protein
MIAAAIAAQLIVTIEAAHSRNDEKSFKNNNLTAGIRITWQNQMPPYQS